MGVCDTRAHVQDQLRSLDFAHRLWHLFRALIHDAVEGIQREIRGATDIVMSAIDDCVQEFFVKSLQLDVFTLELEFK